MHARAELEISISFEVKSEVGIDLHTFEDDKTTGVHARALHPKWSVALVETEKEGEVTGVFATIPMFKSYRRRHNTIGDRFSTYGLLALSGR